jgi:hypothetical protein
MFDWNFLKLSESGAVPVKKWNALVSAVRRATITSAAGATLHVTDSGTSISIARPGGTSSSTTPTPFQVLTNGENVGILPESTLFKNLKGEKISITGLLTRLSDGTISDSDAGWFACPAIGQKIWLQIGTSAASGDAPRPLVLTEATTIIRSGTAGGSFWDEYPDPVSINIDDPTKPFQEFYNLLLAEVTDPATDTRPALATVTVSGQARQITQMWSRNVSVWMIALNGVLCFVPCDPAPDYLPST